MDKNNIENLLCYYEKDIESYIIKINNNKDLMDNYINILINKLNKVKTKDLLISILDMFFNKRKKYREYKEYIINYISKNYNTVVNTNENDSFFTEFDKFKKSILSNNNLNKEYIILYSNNYWAKYAFDNNLSKKELISIAKKNNLSNSDLILFEKSLKFIKTPSKDELNKFENDLIDYAQIYSLKPYIENWRTIKTNQINNSTLSQDVKITYFKELERDYTNLLIYYDTNYKDIQKLFEQINSRNYMIEFNIDFTVTDNFNSILNSNSKRTNHDKKINTIRDELLNIKKYQDLTNKPKKY